MNKLFLSLTLITLYLGAAAPVEPKKDCCPPAQADCCKDACCKAGDHCCKGAEHKACKKECKPAHAPKA